ncbi:MAG: winged helix-turn-helix domain-containing protein [Actinomycetota bacterium]|nr:winged helix-turn-helix domain-containing protein [Actinomycetota bacterium]
MSEPNWTTWSDEKRLWWEKPAQRSERMERILACLRENARMPLAQISHRTKIPVSTVWDCMKVIEQRFWFTAVFLDSRAENVRAKVAAHPTARHRELAEVAT